MTNEPWPLGLSSCGSPSLSEAVFAGYRDAGIRLMEISLPCERYASLDLSAVAALARRYGVRLWSIHLPFDRDFFNIAHPDAAVRAACLLEQGRLLERAAKAGISLAVIHPSSEPIEDSERERAMENARNSLRSLAAAADRLGVTLAVENLPRSCLGRDGQEMLRLLDADPRLVSCFDTNHLLRQSAQDYLKLVGKHIRTIHVSDYDFINERHVLPGEGKVDWPALLDALRSVGYSGPFLYELGLVSTANIEREKPLKYTDFADNYACLLRGETPSPLGRPLF